MKILIIGGSGFIGSHLVDALAGKHKVCVIDLKKGVNKKAKYYVGNILDKKFLEEVFKKEKFKAVFHLAADASVSNSVINPYTNFENNVVGSLNVLEECRKNKVKYFLFASSSTVYGNRGYCRERDKFLPISPYGASKGAVDLYLNAYSKMYGINVSSLVLANIFGPRNNKGVMFDFYNKLRENQKELEILGDGNQSKSYVFIDDCVNAFLLVFHKMIEGELEGYNMFNVSSDEQISVKGIAKIMSRILCLNPLFKFKENWRGDVENFLLDNSKLKRLGWRIENNTEKGIEKYLMYLIKN